MRALHPVERPQGLLQAARSSKRWWWGWLGQRSAQWKARHALGSYSSAPSRPTHPSHPMQVPNFIDQDFNAPGDVARLAGLLPMLPGINLLDLLGQHDARRVPKLLQQTGSAAQRSARMCSAVQCSVPLTSPT